MRRKPYWMVESEKRKFVQSLEDTRKGRPSVVGAPAHHTGWAVHPAIHSRTRAAENHLLLVTETMMTTHHYGLSFFYRRGLLLTEYDGSYAS